MIRVALIFFCLACHGLGWWLCYDCIVNGGVNTSLRPDWVTVKATTAFLVTFSSAGVIGWMIQKQRVSDFFCGIVVIAGLMTMVFGPRIVLESTEAVRSVAPGMPSDGTLTGLITIHFGIFFSTFSKRLSIVTLAIPWLMSVSAFYGYGSGDSRFYFESETSTAMALLTAIEIHVVSLCGLLFNFFYFEKGISKP